MGQGNEKKIGAFFDVDYTVLSNNSATLFVKYMMRRGEVGVWALLNTLYYVARYKLNLLDFETLAVKEVARYKGQSEAEMIELCDRWFDEMVIDYIYPGAREKIEEHKEKGDVLVLLSAATVYLVRPLAEHLGIEHYLCNRLEVDETGTFTGAAVMPFCYGEGKIFWAEKLAEELGIDLDRSLYYSDSVTDLPVLERFGRPVAVNPDALLAKEARKRDWPAIKFSMDGES